MSFQVSKEEWSVANTLFQEHIDEYGVPPKSGWKISRTDRSGEGIIKHSFICLEINGAPKLFALDHQDKSTYLGTGYQAEKVKLVLNQEEDIFALKVMNFDHNKASQPPYHSIEQQKEAFRREASCLALMGYGHAATTRVNSKGIEKGYLLQDYFDGKTLGDLLGENENENEQAITTPQHALQLLRSLCQEFKRMKAVGIAHNDLKITNIIICGLLRRDENPSSKIIDFGTSIDRKTLASNGYSLINRKTDTNHMELELTDLGQLISIITIISENCHLDDDVFNQLTSIDPVLSTLFPLDSETNQLTKEAEELIKRTSQPNSNKVTPDMFYDVYDKALFKYLNKCINVLDDHINMHSNAESLDKQANNRRP